MIKFHESGTEVITPFGQKAIMQLTRKERLLGASGNLINIRVFLKDGSQRAYRLSDLTIVDPELDYDEHLANIIEYAKNLKIAVDSYLEAMKTVDDHNCLAEWCRPENGKCLELRNHIFLMDESLKQLQRTREKFDAKCQ